MLGEHFSKSKDKNKVLVILGIVLISLVIGVLMFTDSL
jgi:hypothetical protein